MRTFSYQGVTFPSLKAFADARGVKLSALRRLCRTYRRAALNPAVACEWLLEGTGPDTRSEALTVEGMRDREMGRARAVRHRAGVKARRIRRIADMLKISP